MRSPRGRICRRRDTDRWEAYAPMSTPRHGLGAALVGDAIHVAGGGPAMGGAVHDPFTLG
jgi:hypothetical protein